MRPDDRDGDRDVDLSRLFEAQRREDESLAPVFSELLARPRRHRRRGSSDARTTWPVALSAATVLVIVTATAVLLRRLPEHGRFAPDSELLATASALAEWKAPSDSLLETPGADLLREVPTLESPDSTATTVEPAARTAVPQR